MVDIFRTMRGREICLDEIVSQYCIFGAVFCYESWLFVSSPGGGDVMSGGFSGDVVRRRERGDGEMDLAGDTAGQDSGGDSRVDGEDMSEELEA